jgi:predicted phage-related endonuclease
MKITKSQSTISVVERYKCLKSSQSSIEKEMKVLREELIGALGGENSMLAGQFLIILSQVTRTDIDKKALAADLGDDIHKYEKQTSYDRIDIKKA